MGINISLHRILSIEKKEGYSGQEFDFCKTERIDWFDYLRYSGDREFIGRTGHWKDMDSEGEYSRPIDMDEMREWVKENIHIGNQDRLLKAIDLMEKDEMVGIYLSY